MSQVPLNHRWNLQKIIALIILLCALIGGVIFFLDYLIGPVDHVNPMTVLVEIPEGSGVTQIAKRLESAGVIRDISYFRAVSRLLGVESKLQAGYYEFSTGMSIKTMIEKMVKGRIATYKLTVPEGLTIKEMAPLIEARTGIPAEEFLRAAREYRLNFTPDQDVEFMVEGFLFPDTYQMPYRVTADELIAMMVNRFIKMAGVEPMEIRGRLLSIWEIATIASLIEEEAKLDVDRPKISGVIYNRLEERMNLQLCASVLYVLGVKKDRLSIADTKIRSPYNTYRNPGLPPGPISNPSIKSLRAAMNPAEVDYLFYFAMPDGSTYYTKTYREHLAAVAKYLD